MFAKMMILPWEDPREFRDVVASIRQHEAGMFPIGVGFASAAAPILTIPSRVSRSIAFMARLRIAAGESVLALQMEGSQGRGELGDL